MITSSTLEGMIKILVAYEKGMQLFQRRWGVDKNYIPMSKCYGVFNFGQYQYMCKEFTIADWEEYIANKNAEIQHQKDLAFKAKSLGIITFEQKKDED